MSRLEVFGIDGIGEIIAGDDLAGIIAAAAASSPDTALADGDVCISMGCGDIATLPDEVQSRRAELRVERRQHLS